MMRVGDRDGEGVGGVGAGDLHSGKQARDHRVDLRLLRAAGADDRLLDQPSGIFADLHASARRDHDDHAARLAELERRLRVGVDEDFLDGSGVGPLVRDEAFQLFTERGEAPGQGCRSPGLDLAVGDMAEAVAFGLDQSPARGSEARVQAQDPYVPLPLAGGVRGGNVVESTVGKDMPSPSPSRKREGG